MQPPPGSGTGRPWLLFVGRPDENRNDRVAAIDRGEQRRIVCQAEIQSEADQCRCIIRGARSHCHVFFAADPDCTETGQAISSEHCGTQLDAARRGADLRYGQRCESRTDYPRSWASCRLSPRCRASQDIAVRRQALTFPVLCLNESRESILTKDFTLAPSAPTFNWLILHREELKQPKDCAFQSDWLYTGCSFDKRDRSQFHLL